MLVKQGEGLLVPGSPSLNQAPAFLLNLAGGNDKITNLIVSFLRKFGIVLDTGVSAQQVASTAANSMAG